MKLKKVRWFQPENAPKAFGDPLGELKALPQIPGFKRLYRQEKGKRKTRGEKRGEEGVTGEGQLGREGRGQGERRTGSERWRGRKGGKSCPHGDFWKSAPIPSYMSQQECMQCPSCFICRYRPKATHKSYGDGSGAAITNSLDVVGGQESYKPAAPSRQRISARNRCAPSSRRLHSQARLYYSSTPTQPDYK